MGMPRNVLGAFALMGYYLVVCIGVPTLLRVLTDLPKEVVRKLQHIAYSMSVFLLLRLFSEWYWAISAAFLLVILGYPALLVLEKHQAYKRVFVDRTGRGGELRKQLIFVQFSFAILIFIFWGLLGVKWRYVIAVAVMAWGYGDAAAALVGKTFGKRRIPLKYTDSAKTLEGTTAMILTAAVALFSTMFFYAGKPFSVSLVVSVVVAPLCGVVELFSRGGIDTLTVPLVAAASILPIVSFLSSVGW